MLSRLGSAPSHLCPPYESPENLKFYENLKFHLILKICLHGFNETLTKI
jgi:hypothetical protein